METGSQNLRDVTTSRALGDGSACIVKAHVAQAELVDRFVWDLRSGQPGGVDACLAIVDGVRAKRNVEAAARLRHDDEM